MCVASRSGDRRRTTCLVSVYVSCVGERIYIYSVSLIKVAKSVTRGLPSVSVTVPRSPDEVVEAGPGVESVVDTGAEVGFVAESVAAAELVVGVEEEVVSVVVPASNQGTDKGAMFGCLQNSRSCIRHRDSMELRTRKFPWLKIVAAKRG